MSSANDVDAGSNPVLFRFALLQCSDNRRSYILCTVHSTSTIHWRSYDRRQFETLLETGTCHTLRPFHNKHDNDKHDIFIIAEYRT